MSNDDEVIKSAEGFLNNAFTDLMEQRKAEHIGSMPRLLKCFTELANKEAEVVKNKVYLGYIVPDDELNDTASMEFIDALDFDKNRSDYASAKLRLFWTFDNARVAVESLNLKDTQIMSNELRIANSAVFMFSMRKDYGIAVMIAAHCLVVSRVVGDETVTRHVDMAHSEKGDADSFFTELGLSKGDETLIRQLAEFHEAPMILKSEFPALYAELLKEIEDKMERDGYEKDGDDND